jgi:hypothetical protein
MVRVRLHADCDVPQNRGPHLLPPQNHGQKRCRHHCLQKTQTPSDLAVRVQAEDDGKSLPDAYRTCIYCIVQEALHNIVKHAGAVWTRSRNRTLGVSSSERADHQNASPPLRRRSLLLALSALVS